jgi:hypothetical protein
VGQVAGNIGDRMNFGGHFQPPGSTRRESMMTFERSGIHSLSVVIISPISKRVQAEADRWQKPLGSGIRTEQASMLGSLRFKNEDGRRVNGMGARRL